MKKVFYYLLSLVIIVTGCEKIYTRPTNPAPARDTFFLSVSPTDDIFFSDDGYAQSAQSVKINVTTNQRIWEVSSDQEWCRTYQNLIFNDSTFTVFVDSNTGPVARTATVTVTAEKVPRCIFWSIRRPPLSSISIRQPIRRYPKTEERSIYS